MNPFEARYAVEFTEEMLLFVNDVVRFVHAGEPTIITSPEAEDKTLSPMQREAWAANTLKHKVIAALEEARSLPDGERATKKFKLTVSRLETEVLENATTASLKDKEIQRKIDAEIQPHIVEWRRDEVFEIVDLPRLAESDSPPGTDSLSRGDVSDKLRQLGEKSEEG